LRRKEAEKSMTEAMAAEAVGGRRDRVQLLGVDIDNVTMAEAIRLIFRHTSPGTRARFAFVNADCLNIAHRDLRYEHALLRQDAVFGDGSGIAIAARLRNRRMAENVNGTDMFPLLCEEAARRGVPLFLLGGREGVPEETAQRMQARYPGLRIAGAQNGYFERSHEDAVIERINGSGAGILLVALGVPQQELWIEANRNRLNVPVCIGVGGLFDFYSGRIPRAPLWLRQAGLEWTWRLWQEPLRLWRRYLVGNPLFLARCAEEAVLGPRRLRSPASPLRILYARAKRRAWEARQDALAVSKRAIDVAGAAAALLALSPVFLAAALAIRAESPGPVLFHQTRVGMNGRRFKIWKFRSMYIDAEARRQALLANSDRDGAHFKMKNDPRITRVGRLIRRLSIDELPQLWNVLNGTMSLVGPRPNLESEVRQYKLYELGRLAVRPGITCFWQVSGRAELPWERQVELDLDYIHQRSLKTDLTLMLKTIPAVLGGRGAY
jgi:exopolysaccharide biosynthesis WecB/TagA/CpsF family protein